MRPSDEGVGGDGGEFEPSNTGGDSSDDELGDSAELDILFSL